MKGKYFLFIMLFLSISIYSKAQDWPSADDFGFKNILENGATNVKNQQRSGTCWSFSTVSFIESEMIRMGKKPMDLSELFIVNGIYRDKAENYILRQGDAGFGEGALSHDVIHGYEKYGIVPQSVYSGLPPGENIINHSELVASIKGMLDGIIKNKGGRHWREATAALLNVYMGPVPNEFEYEGKKYTPKVSILKNMLKFLHLHMSLFMNNLFWKFRTIFPADDITMSNWMKCSALRWKH